MDIDGSTPLPRMETARPVVQLDVRRLDRAVLPPEAEEVRLELRYRGRKLGKVDLQRLPGVAWGELLERWVGEEALPQLLPRYLRRHAWRDRRLLARLARLAVEPRTLRQLWAMLHTAPGRWAGEIRRYLIGHQNELLRSKRALQRQRVAEAGVGSACLGPGQVGIAVCRP